MATRPAPELRSPAPTGIRLSLNDPTVRALLWQVVVIGAIGLTGWYLVSNTLDNLAQRKIATGFGFLAREAGFVPSSADATIVLERPKLAPVIDQMREQVQNIE